MEEIRPQGLPGASVQEIVWRPDGPGFFLVAVSPRGQSIGFLEPGGRIHALRVEESAELLSPVPSPDGRWLAFGRLTKQGNVWAVDNF